MTGTLICNYICSQKAKLGTLPKNGALVSTIVSSEMTKAIAKKYNLAYFDVLTGFKYIGEKIKEFEQTGNTSMYLVLKKVMVAFLVHTQEIRTQLLPHFLFAKWQHTISQEV